MSLAYLKQFESKSTMRVCLVALRRFFQTIYNEDKPDIEQCVRRWISLREFAIRCVRRAREKVKILMGAYKNFMKELW